MDRCLILSLLGAALSGCAGSAPPPTAPTVSPAVVAVPSPAPSVGAAQASSAPSAAASVEADTARGDDGASSATLRADIASVRRACASVRSAAIIWKSVRPDDQCPTTEQLRKDAVLDASVSLKDGWGNPYRIVCDVDEITCTTAGPDRKNGTEDDIEVPEKETPPK